jgi:hypothetical protein
VIELFRHLVDKRSIFGIQDQIKQKDYTFSRQGIVVVLSSDLLEKEVR